jgi:50S ribosomal subunit-associated GTPase HflX
LPPGAIAISAQTGAGLEELRAAIVTALDAPG